MKVQENRPKEEKKQGSPVVLALAVFNSASSRLSNILLCGSGTGDNVFREFLLNKSTTVASEVPTAFH